MRIAVLEIPAELEAAAIADRAGADEFAGHQGLVPADMGDDLLEREQHALGHALRTHLAVDARFHLQVVGIADLVRRHDPRPHHVAAVKALAFGRPQPPFHFDALGIARRKIVEDRIAEDVIPGLGGGDVGALAPGDDAEFQFVVHHLAVARPFHGGVGAAHAEAVGEVVDRLLAIDLRQLAERLRLDPRQLGHVVPGARGKLELPARGLQDMQRKRHAVAHLPRLRHRRENLARSQSSRTGFRPCRACRTPWRPVRARHRRRRSMPASMRTRDWRCRSGWRRWRDRTAAYRPYARFRSFPVRRI